MKLGKGSKNILVALLSQVMLFSLGIVVPRFMLVNYGSDVNGLFNSVSQIYSYLALLDAGVGISALQMLYKYKASKDRDEINAIISATDKVYKRISVIYSAFVLVVGILFAVCSKTSISKISVLLVFWIHGIASVVNFRFLAAEKLILHSEGKNYITNSVGLVFQIITSIAKIVLINLQVNIVLLQATYCLITLSQSVVYLIYFHKKYPWIDKQVEGNPEATKQRKDFLLIQISWTVFSCTDMMLLSFFCDLKVVSIYAVYNLVFSSISNLLSSVYNSTQFMLSRTYHSDRKQYVIYHDCYESASICLIYILMSITYLMIIPFVTLYTRGVSDIQYVDPILPILFCCVQLLTWIRYVCGNLVNVAGCAKHFSKVSIIEAAANLIISVVLVNILGIYGVLIGTIVALMFKSNYLLIYTNLKVLKRKPITAYKTVLTNTALFALVTYLNTRLDLSADNYSEWVVKACVVSVVVFSVYLIVNISINYKSYRYMWGMLRERLLRKRRKNGDS